VAAGRLTWPYDALASKAVEQSLQECLEVCSLAPMSALRMPVTTASRKGVSKLAAEAEAHRVILTSHGRPVAIVDSAERLDEDIRRVREASQSVVEAAGELALQRSNRLSLEDVCAKLNIDPQRVRSRAAVKRG
jgi:PHD/YefM family antitoxin component YafN of YafNO toxin-antitoxin module